MLRRAFRSSAARPPGHAQRAGQWTRPLVPYPGQAAKPLRAVQTGHRHQEHSDGVVAQPVAPRVAQVCPGEGPTRGKCSLVSQTASALGASAAGLHTRTSAMFVADGDGACSWLASKILLVFAAHRLQLSYT